MRQAKPVVLSESDHATLEQLTRARTLPARQLERARIVLLAAAGRPDTEIADELGCHRRKAARWRGRFLAGDLEALARENHGPGANRASTRRPSCNAPRRRLRPTPPIGACG